VGGSLSALYLRILYCLWPFDSNIRFFEQKPIKAH
jgi:hypothetical protein